MAKRKFRPSSVAPKMKCFKSYNAYHNGSESKLCHCESCNKQPVKRTTGYNVIKGRIAETLIHELFLKLGYNVFKFGMEYSLSNFSILLQNTPPEVANAIRKMPDLIVQK